MPLRGVGICPPPLDLLPSSPLVLENYFFFGVSIGKIEKVPPLDLDKCVLPNTRHFCEWVPLFIDLVANLR